MPELPGTVRSGNACLRRREHNSGFSLLEVAMYYQPLKFYKPKQNFRGAALAVNYRDDVKAVFMQVAKQTGEKDEGGNFTFDWNGESITMKLGEADIALIHSYLEGKMDECKLFHQTEEFNTALGNTGRAPYDSHSLTVGLSATFGGPQNDPFQGFSALLFSQLHL